ncbi:serine/threonine protein kinase, partial [archaeon]
MRPCNFLVDEYGILKLADFKFTRKIPKEPLKDTPLEERGGSLAYLAPELFSPEGVQSVSSDLWALGCVLFELRSGRVPFGDSPPDHLDDLTNRIRTFDPLPAPIP